VIHGKAGEICLNGAATRRVHKGDLVIIACYAEVEDNEAPSHAPRLVFVDTENKIKDISSQFKGKL